MATMLATSLLLILCLTGISAQEVCNTYGSLRRDPYDCQRYYSCDDHYRNDFTCPQGQVFNEETSQCDSSGRVIGCENGRSRTGDYCSPINPCLHGTCESIGNTFNCTCNDEWIGAYCNYTTNWWSRPRQRCDSTNGIYRRDPNNCRRYNLCDIRYTEDYYCQSGEAFNEEVQRCDSSGTVRGCGGSTSRSRPSGYSRNQCRRHCDHGHCASEGNHYVCRCNDDYSGERCQNPPASSASGTSGRTYTSLIQCSGNCDRGYCETDGSNYRCRQPVQVSGTSGRSYRFLRECRLYCGRRNCVEDGNYYICRETSQDTGRLDACASRPCANGICYNDNSMRGFSCQCYSGFSGPLCESESETEATMTYNQCENRCQRGYCQRQSNGYFSCVCYYGFSGADCGTSSQGSSTGSGTTANICNPNPCGHGTCRNLGIRYMCDCLDGYRGQTCSIPPVSGTSGRSYSSMLQCLFYCERGYCEGDGYYYRCRQTSQG